MNESLKKPATAIAIIGMAGRFPGARNLEQFWQNLRNGTESLRNFSDEELLAAGVDPRALENPAYVKAGTHLDDAALFDAGFFGVSPREAEVMDPQHRAFLECSWEALEDSGYDSDTYAGSIAVFAGSSMNTYATNNLLANADVLASAGGYQAMIGNDKDFLTTRVSYKLNLRGPSIAVQTGMFDVTRRDSTGMPEPSEPSMRHRARGRSIHQFSSKYGISVSGGHDLFSRWPLPSFRRERGRNPRR